MEPLRTPAIENMCQSSLGMSNLGPNSVTES